MHFCNNQTFQCQCDISVLVVSVGEAPDGSAQKLEQLLVGLRFHSKNIKHKHIKKSEKILESA